MEPLSSTMRNAAIVTGVSRGLGAALVAELLDREFTVVGIARTTVPVLNEQSYRFVPFDLTDATKVDDAISPAFEQLLDDGPEMVCLINNAAASGPVGTLGRLSAGEIAWAIL
jgi:benzil reductase ((S)-benzoin forming)